MSTTIVLRGGSVNLTHACARCGRRLRWLRARRTTARSLRRGTLYVLSCKKHGSVGGI